MGEVLKGVSKAWHENKKSKTEAWKAPVAHTKSAETEEEKSILNAQHLGDILGTVKHTSKTEAWKAPAAHAKAAETEEEKSILKA